MSPRNRTGVAGPKEPRYRSGFCIIDPGVEGHAPEQSAGWAELGVREAYLLGSGRILGMPCRSVTSEVFGGAGGHPARRPHRCR
jgi:hypothetical protein